MRPRGLSMLETIFSIGILFVVMLILLNLATTSIWGTKEGGERLAAEAHALSVLEDYRSRSFSSYEPGQTTTQQPYTEDGTTYLAELQVTVPLKSPETLRELTVTVRWDSKRGSRQITLSAYATPLLR